MGILIMCCVLLPIMPLSGTLHTCCAKCCAYVPVFFCLQSEACPSYLFTKGNIIVCLCDYVNAQCVHSEPCIYDTLNIL